MATPKTWAAFKGKFPKWRDSNLKFIEKVDEQKVQYADLTNEVKMQLLKNLKETKKKLEADISEINIGIAAMSELLSDAFISIGTQSTTLSTGELFYLKDEPYIKVIDPQKNNEWFKENGMDEIRTVQWQTQNALVKEALKQNKPIPEGIEIYMKTTVEMRKG